MNNSSLEEILLAALEKGAAERAAFLDNACAGQPELRSRVERLLAANARMADFMERPVVAEPKIGLEPDLSFLTASTRPGSLGRIGHYEILEVVGSGGFGVVLRASDEKLQRVVAIKVLSPIWAASLTARRRFVREAQAAAAVNHDNIVAIYAVEDAGPVPYIVMQFVNGVSLEDKLKREGTLELKAVLRIGLQAAEGLAAAHRQGIVHRDVKPANILLENSVERVKITDFGLARAADDESLSVRGAIAGTPSYMSPEQARGDDVDYRSDLFSLGSVLYACCTGQPPFKASTSLGVMKRVCEDVPRPLVEVDRTIPEWLSTTVAKLLAKKPDERYQSAVEVAEVMSRRLAELQEPGRMVALPAQSPARSTRSRRWMAAAAIALVVLAGLGFSEAAGVTDFIPSIIRIVTGNGVLIVEADDPGVQVTIEGDGGLVITGAGPQEVRLRPGDYQVRASKDGQPIAVDQPLVTVERGGKQVVKISREAPKPLSGSEKLERVSETVAESERHYKLGESLRNSEPWEAEVELRKAIALVEPLAEDLAGQPRLEQKLARYRWSLASSLNLQAVIMTHNQNASAKDAARALAAAKEAVELHPESGYYTNLGMAHFRAKNWQDAIKALEKAPSGEEYNACYAKFARALAYSQGGDKEQARRWFDDAARWMDQNQTNHPTLRSIRAEAKALLDQK